MMKGRVLGIVSEARGLCRKAVGLGLVVAALSSSASAGAPAVPEIDAGSMASAFALLSSGILILINRSRRK
jgi:hypothetical protein